MEILGTRSTEQDDEVRREAIETDIQPESDEVAEVNPEDKAIARYVRASEQLEGYRDKEAGLLAGTEKTSDFNTSIEDVDRDIGREYARLKSAENELIVEGWTPVSGGVVKIGLETSPKGHRLVVIEDTLGKTPYKKGTKYLGYIRSIPVDLRTWLSVNVTLKSDGSVGEFYRDIPESEEKSF